MLYNFLCVLSQISFLHGLKNVILSPGSRVAPLAITFNRHPHIKTYTLSDERAAAYTALGMAQQLVAEHIEKNNALTVPLVGMACTSGTAALNYAPAIAEAFYLQIPLVVFTADRPAEWIDQADNQAIRQENLYGKHVKAAYHIPTDLSHPDALWYAERVINEALLIAKKPPYGPVHINLPFREPFYPKSDTVFEFPKKPRWIQMLPSQINLEKNTWQKLLNDWEQYERKLILVGQGFFDENLLKSLKHLQQDYKVVIVADIIANTAALAESIQHQDIFLINPNATFLETLKPDLLITFGKAFLSKPLKAYFKKYPPEVHWQLSECEYLIDTFQSLTHVVPMTPTHFFEQLFQDLDFKNLLQAEPEEDTPYYEDWQQAERNASKFLYGYTFEKDDFSELEVVAKIMELLPEKALIHFSNSMPVRYANLWGVPSYLRDTEKVPIFYANRGTSGIDGCLSTAVGAAMASPERMVVLLIGDLAFFYDRNGLWNNQLPANLRIILLNNHGGNIFRMIEGPRQQPEFEEYFETTQRLNAANTAKDFEMTYYVADTLERLETALKALFENLHTSNVQLLEIITNKVINAEVYQKLKKDYRKQSEVILK